MNPVPSAGFFVTLSFMKRFILILLLLIVFAAAVAAWIFLGPGTGFSTPKENLYIRSNAANRKAVLDSLRINHIIENDNAFNFLAGQMDYWKNIRPGKYEIKKGSSLVSIIRMLRNGRQTPVNLVITKLRTKEDFARMVGKRFECDSSEMMAFLNNPDSLRNYEADPETAMWNVLPDTYTYHWNSTPSIIYRKIAGDAKKFWTEERRKKAADHGLSPQQAYTLASIIEEETTNNEEKDTIASVYLNRMRTGMPLQADPTVKFALKDFSLKRIYEKYTMVESPYNTYRNRGLPPGPICTPSKTTIDAVLSAPQTPYIYFVASSDFTQSHKFSTSYGEHLVKAREYQEALNRRDSLRTKEETN